jgi:GT2 family glycosyltransferase
MPSFQPTEIVEVDWDRPLVPLYRPGPARLLVRRDGVPVSFVPVQVPHGGLDPDGLRAAIGTPEPAHPRTTGRDRSRLRLSVVVTTCAASDELVRTLDGLQAQSLRPAQILLIDNRPATSGVAEMLVDQGIDDVRLITVPEPGLSRARNAGLAAATGEIVAFTDDDVVVDRRWAECLLDAFVDENVACVTGLVLPWELRTPAQTLFEQFGGFGKGFRRRRFDLAADRDPSPLYPYAAGVFGTGANGAFRAAALRAAGGFDVCLGTGSPARGGEDLDMHLTLIQRGHAIVYEPGALIRHSHHADMDALRKQIFNYGAGLSAMLAKRWFTNRRERRELTVKLVEGMRYLLRGSSPKNAHKSADYPRELTVAELLGFLYGPIAYGISRWTRRGALR